MMPISPILFWSILAGYGTLAAVTLFLIFRLSSRVRKLEHDSKVGDPAEEPVGQPSEQADLDTPGDGPQDEEVTSTGDLPTHPYWDKLRSPEGATGQTTVETAHRIDVRSKTSATNEPFRMDPGPEIGETHGKEVAEDRPLAETTAAVATPPKQAVDAQSFQGAVAAYNALAANFDQAELAAFEERWQPLPMARADASSLVYDSSGDFWLIQTKEGDDHHGLVVPGAEITRKWEMFYRSLGSMAARTFLQGFYEVSDGAPLRLERPAVAEELGKIWRVATPGAFADF